MAGPLLSGLWPGGDAPSVKVYALLCDLLRGDPVLSAAGVSVRGWGGDPKDALPPAAAELPLVRVSPVRSGMGLESEDAWDVDFRVRVDVWTPGTSYADLGNLTHYVRQCLRYNRAYGGTTVLQAFRAAGATVYDFTEAGISATQSEPGGADPSQPGGAVATHLHAECGLVFRVNESALD